MKSTLQGQYAGGVTRGAAWTIDQVIIIVTLALTTWLITTSFGLFGISVQNCPENSNSLTALACYGTRIGLAVFALLISPVYMIFFWTASGQTIGDAILGIRVVRTNGTPMTVPRSIRRFIGYILCFLTLGLGFALVLVDNQRQGLHDTIAGTCVIYAWRGEQNTDTIQRVQDWIARRKQRKKGQPTPADS
jgi:uncharacterized RDD family membrane protein YckC